MGILTDDDIVVALSKQLNLPCGTKSNNLLKPKIEQNLDKIVPHDFSKTNFVLPLSKEGNALTCAVADPLDLLMLDNLKMVTGHDIKLVIATRPDLAAAIQDFYNLMLSRKYQVPSDEKKTAITQKNEETETAQSESTEEYSSNVNQLVEKAEEAPVIKLVDLIIKQAIEQRASDIHIEPSKDKISLRYRIDGALYQIPPPARNLHLPIISRLKILSKIDIAEKRLPQDGFYNCKSRGQNS